MTHRTAAVGRYALGLGTTALAALVFGVGAVHLLFAVPQAILPAVAGLVLFVAGTGTMPAGRRLIERLTGVAISDRRVALAAGSAVALCVLAVGITIVLA